MNDEREDNEVRDKDIEEKKKNDETQNNDGEGEWITENNLWEKLSGVKENGKKEENYWRNSVIE